jgi:ketosteroid isomerase-like protein
MPTQLMKTQLSPLAVMERVQSAQNQHDLEALLDCFDPDYQSEQPSHPHRAFRGREQVRKNWTIIFSDVPNFRSELVRTTTDGDTEWTEWHWSGTHANGKQFDQRGVTIFGVRDNHIVWGRLYMEGVEQGGAGIDEVMQNFAHRTSPEN